MLGLWTWNKHSGRDQKIEPPEFLMPSDVLRWAAASPLTNDFFILGLLIGSEFSLRVSVKVRPLASEDKHQQQLRVQPGRGNIVFFENLIRGINSLFKLHDGRGECIANGAEDAKGHLQSRAERGNPMILRD